MRSEIMEQTYQRAFILSLVLHLIVLVVFATQMNFTASLPKQAVATSAQPIKAVSVNAAQVAAKVAELKAEQQAKQQAEQMQQRQLAQQAAAAKRQRELEQQRLSQLKAEAKKLQQQQAAQAKAEAQRLAKLKAEQAAEQKRLSEMAKQRQMQEAKQQQEAQPKTAQAEQQRKLEEDRLLQQQLVADQQQLDQDKLQAQQGIIDKYKTLILDAISQQWIVPENMPKDISAKLLVQVGPGGVVLDVKLLQSSGNTVLDRSAIAAVRKASPLPVPQDQSLMNEFRELNMTVRPEGVVPG
jgi:colicin import membrane protein